MSLALLWRLAPYLAGIAAVLGAYFWIDHRGYARGYADKNVEVVVAANRLADLARKRNEVLAQVQAQRDAALQTRTDTTQERGRDLQTIVIREAANDPRYRSVECSTTGSMSDAIRAAGLLSHNPTPDALSVRPVPISAAPQR